MMELYFSSFTTSSDIASWVQAIGSIAAIGAAIIISRVQINSDRHKTAQIALEKKEGFAAVAYSALMQAEYLANATTNLDSEQFRQLLLISVHSIQGSINALSTIPLHEIGSANAILGFITLNREMVGLKYDLDQFIAGPLGNHNAYLVFSKCINKRCGTVNALASHTFKALDVSSDRFKSKFDNVINISKGD
ncbi:hypothetical protein [Chromobacterium vaccinii]|uniref:hypothetical protein n=1 Tax=Chromobacterium vaccinii TaxID=1108595 RepID=UPI001319BD59|nr:hypothetical protein [Chromobacterium vaccinii]